jgi:hypothetical protein
MDAERTAPLAAALLGDADPQIEEELAAIAKPLGFTSTSIRLYGGYAIETTLARA